MTSHHYALIEFLTFPTCKTPTSSRMIGTGIVLGFGWWAAHHFKTRWIRRRLQPMAGHDGMPSFALHGHCVNCLWLRPRSLMSPSSSNMRPNDPTSPISAIALYPLRLRDAKICCAGWSWKKGLATWRVSVKIWVWLSSLYSTSLLTSVFMPSLSRRSSKRGNIRESTSASREWAVCFRDRVGRYCRNFLGALEDRYGEGELSQRMNEPGGYN